MTPTDPPPDTPRGPVVHIPDDARDLHRDVRALERERRVERRRARVRKVLLTRRWDRYGLSGPLVVLILLAVAAYGLLPVLLRPSSAPRQESRPLATPVAAPGTPGGLLPEAPLLTPAGRTTTRDLDRPEALLLVPLPCACEEVLADVVAQVLPRVNGIRILTQAAADPDGRRAAGLRSGPGRGQVDSGVDLTGALARAYAPVGVTVVLVAADGAVVGVVRDVQPDQKLDRALQALTH